MAWFALPSSVRRAARIALTIAALVLACFATALQANAVDNGTLGIRPANESDFFHISLYPGAAVDATAVVTNHTPAPVTLLNYAVDGQSTAQGALALASQTDDRKGVGAWVHLESENITVPANSELKVGFRLSVPAGTPPGDYAGGLIIQSPKVQGKTTTVNGDTAVRLDTVERQGVRIYLNVAGTALKSLTHGDLAWQQDGDTLTFTLPVHNTGNTILHPAADLNLTGWPLKDTHLTFDTPESLLPGGSLDLHARIPAAPPALNGDADAKLTSEAGTAQANAHILYAPWLLIAIVLLVLIAGTYGARRGIAFIRRARAALARTSAEDPVPAGRHRHES